MEEKNLMKKLRNVIANINIENLIVRFICSWLIACIININVMDSETSLFGMDFVLNVNLMGTLAIMIVFFSFITVANVLLKDKKTVKYFLNTKHISIIDYGILIVVVPFFSINAISITKDVYIASVLAALSAWVIWYAFLKFKEASTKIEISSTSSRIIIGAAVLFVGGYVLTLLVLRYFIFRTATFDFGIFAQMFHNMKETFLPMTTCERNRMLSHFNVHMSPIFYLILPIYFVFPHPVTLIVVQYLLILSGVIPLYLICKKKNFKKLITVCLCIVYLNLPAVTSGLFYDFHENKFLVPILMWLIYFIESKRLIGIGIFSVLTLLVKEDAAIYVACLGLFLLFGRSAKREKKTGIFMIIGAVIYFFIVYSFLSTGGEGAMINRYGNFINAGGGVTDIIVTIFKNPAYFVSQIINTKKIEALLWYFVPVLFIPFMSKKVSTYILLIPALVMTFMTSNPYQSTIDYQYSQAPVVFILYVVILYFAGELTNTYSSLDESKRHFNTLAVMIVVASAVMFSSIVGSKKFYIDEYETNKTKFLEVESILESIPEDASVLASSFYATHLTNREQLYKYPYEEDEAIEFEYIIYDLRYQDTHEAYYNDYDSLIFQGYEEYKSLDNYIVVMKKTK